ncbi:restriction endonuclease [Paenibacillus melissococcoides]|uniref:Restriction endonuclease n=1 Tax=Paenibacillus melissococcoides TaxID=2912268 RepID=A0ABM9FWP1_9BACL|nr:MULTISPECIES: restriction endonuclease [Paenibacillus]MEB9896151.1 restriction endonuclease [Bacillus cereus]CAH8243589.1 restriction endonuclease [Paenibacillus melissococcoides]CAH8704953.1 restriction endonuclease [Paenibacillus melissococcoides]CAH8708180.1 restriction endonuclease [Paenibacillus melissococcoides]GIO79954.1 hypothetical protein J6TS7_35640 [Paenibacillus dendritiformis]
MLKKKFNVTGLLAFLSLALVFLTSVSASANTRFVSSEVPTYFACEDIKGEVSYEKDENGKIVKKVIKVSDVEGYAKQFGITLPSPDAEIYHISPVTEMMNITNEPTPTSTYQPLWVGELYIKNIEGPREACGSQVIRLSYFDYPGGTMSVTESVQASYGGSVSVSAELVSAAVNFNVTNTFTVSDTQNIQVPYGKRAKVTAYPTSQVYQYDVYKKGILSDSYEGYGYAEKPVGVCFNVIIY